MKAIDMLTERYALYFKMFQVAQELLLLPGNDYYKGDSHFHISKNKSGLYDNIKVQYNDKAVMHIVHPHTRKNEFLGYIETDAFGTSINVNQYYSKCSILDEDDNFGRERQHDIYDLNAEGIEEQLFQESLLDNNALFTMKLFISIVYNSLSPYYEYYLRTPNVHSTEMIKEIIEHLQSVLDEK